MNIQFEAPDKVNGLMTITMETADYQPEVEKTLKDYRKRAQIPGFRPGQAPMGMIKRQFGTSVKVDVVNKLLGEIFPASSRLSSILRATSLWYSSSILLWLLSSRLS